MRILVVDDEPALRSSLQRALGLDRHVVELLRRLSADEGLTVMLITHDPSIADAAQRVVRMRDGRVLEPEEALPVAGVRSAP